MIKLLQWLIFGHAHKYTQVEALELRTKILGEYTGKAYILRCDCCGKMKCFKVEAND